MPRPAVALLAAIVALISYPFLVTPAHAQNASMPAALPRKDQVVTLKIPAALLAPNGITGWSLKSVYQADVTGFGDTIFINGKQDWQTEGFPSMFGLRVDKIERKNDRLIVQLNPTMKRAVMMVRLSIAPGLDLATTLSKLLIYDDPESAASHAYRHEALRLLGRKAFTGDLARVPEDDRFRILDVAQSTLHAVAVSSETYKGQHYVTFDIGSGDSIFNDLQFSQSGMITYVFNNRVIQPLKVCATAVAANGIDGVKITAAILHRDFLRERNLPPHLDTLQIYTPLDAIHRFAQSDITSQQVADASIVLHNDNRIEVLLSATQK
jgi:hypothetical protein